MARPEGAIVGWLSPCQRPCVQYESTRTTKRKLDKYEAAQRRTPLPWLYGEFLLSSRLFWLGPYLLDHIHIHSSCLFSDVYEIKKERSVTSTDDGVALAAARVCRVQSSHKFRQVWIEIENGREREREREREKATVASNRVKAGARFGLGNDTNGLLAFSIRSLLCSSLALTGAIDRNFPSFFFIFHFFYKSLLRKKIAHLMENLENIWRKQWVKPNARVRKLAIESFQFVEMLIGWWESDFHSRSRSRPFFESLVATGPPPVAVSLFQFQFRVQCGRRKLSVVCSEDGHSESRWWSANLNDRFHSMFRFLFLA